MSICYWAIQGYGVNVGGKVFDLEKVTKELNINKEIFKEKENPLEDICECEILDTMLSKPEFIKHHQYLCFGDTGNNDNGIYLYYCPRYPWDMDEEEKNMTKKEIEQMIVDILLRVTVLSEEEILESFEEISTGGEG